MPVRYDIAAGVPQAQGGGFDPMNAFATMQAMSYRQQQNALAQLQAEKLQRELHIQNVLSGLDISSPASINALSRAGYLPEALSVMGSQRSAARERAYEEAARGELELKQRKFKEIDLPHAGREEEKLGYEIGKLSLEEKEAALRGKKLQQDIRKFEEIEMPKAFSELERSRDEQKISNQTYLKNKAEYYRDYFKNFVTNQTTLDRLVDLMDQDKDFPAGGAAFRGVQFTPEWKASQLISPEKQAELAKPEYVDLPVTDASGAQRYVRVRKNVPGAVAEPLAGTEGAKPVDYSFGAGPAGTGTMYRADPRTGQAALFTPTQPGQMPPNMMAPAPVTQNSFANAPAPTPTPTPTPTAQGMLAPRARATGVESLGITPAPLGTKERDLQDTATGVLRTLNYNPDTGVDIVESTLSRAPSGMLQAKGTDISRVFGRDSAAASADAELKRLSASLVKTYSGDKLAAQGFSNTDAKRVEQLTADIGNSDLTIGERRDAYRSLKREITRQIGIEYKNPYDPQGIKKENVMRQRVEETPSGFTVADPDGGVHTFDDRKKAAEFLTYMQRMTMGRR